jgi:hypothetical protein
MEVEAFVKGSIFPVLVVDFVSQLSNPEFLNRNESVFGGAPVLLVLWQRLDLSLLLTQSGIFKIRGLAACQGKLDVSSG